MRGALAEAYSARGHHLSNLWYVYSLRDNRDWVLKSDVEWAHFLLVESDASVVAADYAPAPVVVRVGDDNHSTTLDAVLTFRDGSIEWREIKVSNEHANGDVRAEQQMEAQIAAASLQGARYARFSVDEIFKNPQRIANWARIVAWLSSVRGRSIYSEQLEVLTLVSIRGSASLKEIQELACGGNSVCHVAAAFKSVQDGLLISDLDDKPLTQNTRFQQPNGL